MSLWDKVLKSGLILLVPALFFIACEEELNNVGTNTTGDQLDLLFKEFTLPSHVIIDSVKTSELSLLTGKYVDPEFGTVTSEAYSGFSGGVSIDLTADDIVFDSLILNLKLTPYYYGAKTETPIIFKIHELTEEITDISDKVNFSEIMYDPTPLGEVSFSLDPSKYDTLVLAETDILKIKLSDLYFQRIQDTLTSTTASPKNTTLAISPEAGFYGFAILALDADKVVGISAGTGSQLTVHYHTPEADSIEYDYSFTAEGFNKITSDRSGTVLAEVKDDAPSTPFTPANNLRYVQAGTGIATEIDFQPFIDFFKDTPNVILNSAGLHFGEVESTQGFAAPSGLVLNQTDENSEESSIDIDGNPLSSVFSDARTQQFLPLNVESAESNTGIYFELPTAYFQLLRDAEVERSTVTLRPASSTIVGIDAYTVDRFIVHQDSIKLRVYYTIPK